MADSNEPTPLTDRQIRKLFQDIIESNVKVGLDVVAFQNILLRKGYVTEAEVAAEQQEVTAESQRHLARMIDAIRQGPAGGIQ